MFITEKLWTDVSFLSMLDTLYKKYNHKNTLLVFSSYAQTSEAMKDQNALAWYTKHLLSSLPKNKQIVFLSEKTDATSNLPYEAAENILIIPCWKKYNPFSIIETLKTLNTFSKPKRILFQFEFNIFGTALGPLITLFLTCYMSLLGKKIYFQIHQIVTDISSLKDQINIESPIVIGFFNFCLHIFYRSIFFFSDKVIVTEEALAARLRSFTRAKKLVILHHHVLKEEAVQVSLKNKKETTILFFGYISWYKGVDWLVDTFKELHAKNPKLKLVIAGGESPTLKNKPHYKRYYRSLMNAIKDIKGITHTGFVTDEEAREWFAKSDVLVLPYRTFMSSSGPLSWALALQKPVVLASTLKEYMQSPDFVEAMNETDLKDADLFFDLSTESFKKIVQNITRRVMLEKLVQFSTSLAEKRSQKNIAIKLMQILYPVEQPKKFRLGFMRNRVPAAAPLSYAK